MKSLDDLESAVRAYDAAEQKANQTHSVKLERAAFFRAQDVIHAARVVVADWTHLGRP